MVPASSQISTAGNMASVQEETGMRIQRPMITYATNISSGLTCLQKISSLAGIGAGVEHYLEVLVPFTYHMEAEVLAKPVPANDP